MTNGLILIASAMLGPIYALFVDKVGGDILDAGFAGAAFSLAAGFTVIISGKLTDKIKEKELILVVGYVIMGLGFLSYIVVSSMWMLLIAQIVIGFGEAIYVPAFDAVYSKHLEEDNIGSQWGAWESMNYFATAGGAVVGGFVATKFGFSPLFVIMAILSIASGFYIWRLPRKIL
jgi:MFS family permease